MTKSLWGWGLGKVSRSRLGILDILFPFSEVNENTGILAAEGADGEVEALGFVDDLEMGELASVKAKIDGYI